MRDRTIIRTANIQRYFSDINKQKYEPIKDDNVMREMFKDRQQFRDIIINSHIRLVATIAKDYDNADRFMDFNQVGIEGLLEAFEKYDPNQTAKFSSYASYWIKANMSMLCKEMEIIQRSNQLKIGSKAQKFQEQFFKENMRDPSTDEIVSHLKKKYDIDVLYKNEIYNVSVKSINEELYDDGFTPETSGEFAVKTASENDFIKTIEDEDVKDAISKMMKCLNEKERKFITRHFYNDESYESIADSTGYSIERVRQIVVGGLKKMKSSEIIKKRFGGYLK